MFFNYLVVLENDIIVILSLVCYFKFSFFFWINFRGYIYFMINIVIFY